MRRRDEVLVGTFTTVAVLVAVLASVWLIRGGLEAGYPLHSRFPWGAGLKQGQPVWLVGVDVGFVDKVVLDPRGTLVVTLRIQKEYKVPKGSTATLVPNGFFGDMAVALTPKAPSEDAYAPGDTLPAGIPSTGLATLTARADTLSAGLSVMLGELREQMVDSGGLEAMRRSMITANRVIAQIGEIAAVQSRELEGLLSTARSRLAAIDSAKIDSTIRSVRAGVGSLQTVAADMRTTVDRVNTLLAKVETGEGSIARLINDPGLYQDTRKLMTRFDSLLAEVTRNPRKFLTFSVFSW
jgi:phospholipid/cholesterol/gamma-HCH transport system substrate-binding protein